MLKQVDEIKVKIEKYPTRCDICHLSDLFDPYTEQCLRCNTTKQALEQQIFSEMDLTNRENSKSQNQTIMVIGIIVVVLNVILCIICVVLSLFI